MQQNCLGLRTDLNSNVSDGRLEDTVRIDKYIPYLESLSRDFNTIYVMSHQGRKGGDDYISLKPHSQYISSNSNVDVVFCPKEDITEYSRYSSVESDVVMLDNIRFFESETDTYRNPEEAMNTEVVDQLSSYFCTYINDAFSVSHRRHASIVGFPAIMESDLGPLFKEEINSFGGQFWEADTRCCIVGGSKLEDKCKYIHSFIENDNVEYILTTGEVSNVFLDRLGHDVGTDYGEKLSKGVVEKVDESLENEDVLYFPDDVAVNQSGRKHKRVGDLEGSDNPLDIGRSTISNYKSKINDADSVLMAGPPGMYEEQGFEKGTVSLLQEVSSHNSGVIAGGDTILSAETLGISGFKHSSYGGGSALHYLSRDSIPGTVYMNYSDNW